MAVYDPEEKGRLGYLPDDEELRYLTGIGQDEEDEIDRRASTPEDGDEPTSIRTRGFGKKRVSDDPKQLAEQEEDDNTNSPTPAETSESSELGDDQEGEFAWRAGGKRKRSMSLQNLGSSKSKLLIGAGVGGGVVFIIMFIMLLMALRIPHFMENVTSWQFARTARMFRQSVQDITSEKLTMEAADETLSKNFVARKLERWQGLRTSFSDKITNQFRPEKIVDNLETSGRLQYITENTTRSLWKGQQKVFKGIILDGETIPYGSTEWGKYFGSRDGRLEFTAKLSANLDQAIEGSNTLVRSKVGNVILKRAQLKRVFWKNKGGEYSGLKNAEADRLLQRESYQAIHTDASKGCLVPETCESVKKATDELEKKLDDTAAQTSDDALEDTAKAATKESDDHVNGIMGQSDDAVKEALGTALKENHSGFNTALRWTSTINAFAMPACIVFDGSIAHSKDVMQAKQDSSLKNYLVSNTQYSQLKAGAVKPAAQGAASRKLGNVGATNAQMRSNGQVPDTAASMAPIGTPETSAQGTFNDHTISIIGENQGLNSVTETGCKILLNPAVAVGVAVAETIAGFVSAGWAKEAEVGVSEAARIGIQSAIDKVVAQFAENGIKGVAVDATRGLGSMASSMFKQVAIAGGITLIARANIMARMNVYANGLTKGTDQANRTDMDNNFGAQRMNQQFLYARAYTPDEEAEDFKLTANYLSDQQKLESPYQRYFALTNASSLASRFGFSLMGRFDGGLAKSFTNFMSSTSTILNPSRLVTGLFSQKVKAASVSSTGSLNYYITQFGWTESELKMAEQDDYMPINNAEFMDRATINGKPALTFLSDKFDKCFTGSMADLVSDGDIQKDDNGHVIANQGLCSPVNLGVNNPDYGDLVFRYRLYKMRENTMDHLLDIQDPRNSETDIDSGGALQLNVIRGKTDDIECTVGGKGDVVVGYSGGQAYQIRVCNVQGIRVNSQIATQVDAMLTAAKKVGINLVTRSGAYRTMEDQVALRKSNGCPDIYNAPSKSCAVQTARPGFSNHQMGFAIDFNCNGVLITSVTNACYKWLELHAAGYGLQVLSSGREAWHWSVNGN